MSTKFSGPPMPPPMPPICRKPPDSQLPPTAPPQLTVGYAWTGTDYAGTRISDSGVIHLFRNAGSPPIIYDGWAAPEEKPTRITLQGQPNHDTFYISATLQSATYAWHTASWVFEWRDSANSAYHHTELTDNPYEHLEIEITILRASPEKAPNEL